MSTKGIQHSWRIMRNMHQSHCETQHTCRDGCNNQETNTQNVETGIVVHHWQECKRVQTLWKTFCQCVKWLIRELPYDSATPKCESKRNENRCPDKNLHTNTHQQCRWRPNQKQPKVHLLVNVFDSACGTLAWVSKCHLLGWRAGIQGLFWFWRSFCSHTIWQNPATIPMHTWELTEI